MDFCGFCADVRNGLLRLPLRMCAMDFCADVRNGLLRRIRGGLRYMFRPDMCYVHNLSRLSLGQLHNSNTITVLRSRCPKTSENFNFHRVVPNGSVQGGDIYPGSKGDGGESVYGPTFED
ncbi:unnamed protein product [Pleuronectes platessa]|uniref:PPIase cyclophilin-type domain-containing protein n=1 Tax=Pleuronectes platessa TaxID=8262 RepID=A0A9N7VKI8_PLEPL|nr:unnamed protein product [Pleuronectes platessa]